MTITERTEIIDDLVTTTWYTVKPGIIDQVLKITPFFDMMVEKGKIKDRVPDGTGWQIPIRYSKLDQNIQWFGRAARFGRAEKQHLTRMLCEKRNLGASVVRFWDDDQKNRGRAQLEEYAAEKVSGTKDALVDVLETATLNQDSDPLAITALTTLIANDPTTGTVQGIDRSANSWARNQIKDFSGLTTETSLLAEMTDIFNRCSEYKTGARRVPDIILTTRAIYQEYEAICRNLQQIVADTSKRVSLGFGELAFKGVPIYWSPEMPSGRMLFLNTEHLDFLYDPGVYFEMTEWKTDADSLDRVAQILTTCQMTCDCFLKQGVIFNIA